MDINKKINQFLNIDDLDSQNQEASIKQNIKADIKKMQNNNYDDIKNEIIEEVSVNPKNNKLVSRIFDPKSYHDAQSMANALINNQIVYVYLHKLDDIEANRIIDFLTGVVYGIAGDIERLDSELFICTPNNIEITDELRVNINNGGLS